MCCKFVRNMPFSNREHTENGQNVQCNSTIQHTAGHTVPNNSQSNICATCYKLHLNNCSFACISTLWTSTGPWSCCLFRIVTCTGNTLAFQNVCPIRFQQFVYPSVLVCKCLVKHRMHPNGCFAISHSFQSIHLNNVVTAQHWWPEHGLSLVTTSWPEH